MKLVSAGLQQVRHPLYDASGTITTGGTPQLVLAQSQARSFLLLGNNSAGDLLFEIGSARATSTISNGAVTGFTITNAGFGFTVPPVVRLLGGGNAGNSSFLGLNQPNGAAPSNVATAVAVLTGGAVSGFTITNPGSGYVKAPYVFIFNSDLDPYGAAVPSATTGILIKSGSPPVIFNGTCCPTDPVAVFGATTGAAFTCKWMD